MVLASGFSAMTCFPASRAAIATSACRCPGTHTSTMSMSSRSSTSRQSVADSVQPYCQAAAATASASRPTSTCWRTPGAPGRRAATLRHAWECALPMKAYPMTATPGDPAAPDALGVLVTCFLLTCGDGRSGEGPEEGQAVSGELVLGGCQRTPDGGGRGDGGVVGGEALDDEGA